MIALAFLLAGAPAPDCSTAFEREGRAGLNRCMAEQLEIAQLRLQQVWRRAVVEAADRDEDVKGLTGQGGWSKELEISQRAWTAWKDAECTLRAHTMRGGTGEASVSLGCQSDMITARIAQLEEFVR